MSNNELTPSRNPTLPEDKPGSRLNPRPRKPRGRKPSKSTQAGPKKQPQRGMGVAQLEQVLYQQQKLGPFHYPAYQHLTSPSYHYPYSYQYPYYQPNPLAGFPVQPSGFPVYLTPLVGDTRSSFRVLSGPQESPRQLPSMSKDHSNINRVSEDGVRFMRSKETYANDDQNLPVNRCIFAGFELNNGDNGRPFSINEGFSCYDGLESEVESRSKMREHGFLPNNSEANYEEGNLINQSSSSITTQDNNTSYMEQDLNLNLAYPYSLSSSSSTSSPTSLDLSLKLSS